MAKKDDAFRLLIVDDEKSIRRFLKVELAAKGYRVYEAADGESALDALVSNHPDVVILDLGLPDKDGIDIIREIRSWSQTPIIVVSVRDQEKEKIAALDAGADDYLTKPFSAEELSARLRAVVRRWIPKDKEEVFKMGDLVVDITKRNVKVGDRFIHLTPTEYEVLKTLIFNAGKVVTHQQFFREVWNRNNTAGKIDHLLRVTVNKLRNKIEPNPDRPAYILTEPAIGYRLSCNF